MAKKEEVKLLGTWMSPFVLRIKWAMKIKGIEYEFIEEDLSDMSPLLLEYNPVYKKVPVLVHNGKPICESLLVLEYIDETWKENPIMPEDPYDRAMARFWSKFGKENCFPSIWQVFASNGKQQEEAMTMATENFKILEEELKGKKFFNGETVGLTDISFGWIAYMLQVLEDIIEQKMIDEVRFPLLLEWITNFSGVAEIKDCLPPHERLLTKFRYVRESSSASKGH